MPIIWWENEENDLILWQVIFIVYMINMKNFKKHERNQFITQVNYYEKKHESQENNYYIQWNDINGNLVDLELHPWPSLQIDLDFYL